MIDSRAHSGQLNSLLKYAASYFALLQRCRTSCGLAARPAVRMQFMISSTMRMNSASICDSGGAASPPAEPMGNIRTHQ